MKLRNIKHHHHHITHRSKNCPLDFRTLPYIHSMIDWSLWIHWSCVVEPIKVFKNLNRKNDKVSNGFICFCIKYLFIDNRTFYVESLRKISNSKVPTLTNILRWKVVMVSLKNERSSFIWYIWEDAYLFDAFQWGSRVEWKKDLHHM